MPQVIQRYALRVEPRGSRYAVAWRLNYVVAQLSDQLAIQLVTCVPRFLVRALRRVDVCHPVVYEIYEISG